MAEASLVLYDVTSSYFEGRQNELAEFGHNRDGKSRTIGHVFCAMMGLKISREIQSRLKAAFGTTDEGADALTIKDALNALSRLCFQRQDVSGQQIMRLPRPDQRQEAIFKALGVTPPRNGNREPA